MNERNDAAETRDEQRAGESVPFSVLDANICSVHGGVERARAGPQGWMQEEAWRVERKVGEANLQCLGEA